MTNIDRFDASVDRPPPQDPTIQLSGILLLGIYGDIVGSLSLPPSLKIVEQH
jgi:hypothetical protein